MPDPAPAAPAPAAAAPTPTPTPPVAPSAPPPEPPKPTSKELANKLFGLLTANPEAPKPPEKREDAPPPPPAPAAPAPKPPEEKPIKRKAKEQPAAPAAADTPPPIPKKEDLRKPDPAPTPTPTPSPVKPEPTDVDFEKELVDEERAQLEDARNAEKYGGEKYKGHGAKMISFLKENARRAAGAEKGELDGKPYDAAAYEEWHAANLPRISVLDQRQINRLAVKDDLTREIEPKIAEERHERWVESEAPKIKAKGNDIHAKLSNSALPDNVMAAITERTKGITDRGEYIKKVQEVQKDYALEFEIAENVINVATNDIEEFHRLTTINPATNRPVVAFDPANPTHERLINMVGAICKEFKETAGADLKKDGKWFVTREEWQGMAPEQRGPFWTFTNDQIIDRAMGKVKGAVATLVDAEQKKLEARGFKRTIAAAPAAQPPAPAPTPGAPPAPRPTPPPPGGSSPQPSIGASLAGKLTSQPAAQ
jgi:hypothetical protein